MKYLKTTFVIFSLFLVACNQNSRTEKPPADTTKAATAKAIPVTDDDKKQIQNLIRKMLTWAEAKNSFDLVPLIARDSVYTGFDLDKLQTNLQTLKATGFFATEFIDNYRQIILTLAQKMKGKTWSNGELPPYNFANDYDPWCNCQDVPYDKPSPWGIVEVSIISLDKDKGRLYWKWGKPATVTATDDDNFTYKFSVQKEDGKWKIAYLQEFDLIKSTKVI